MNELVDDKDGADVDTIGELTSLASEVSTTTPDTNATTPDTNVTTPDRFTVDDDGITDNITDLVWDKNASDVGACVSPKTVPTLKQFQTIIDYTKGDTDPKAAPAVIAGFNLAHDFTHYKTSDDWDVYLKYGTITKGGNATKTVCVDASAYTAPEAVTATRNDTDNTVTDSNGLVWTDSYIAESNYKPQTFEKAEEMCSNMNMRLPTLVELDSIYDRANGKFIDGFKTVYTSTYWTTEEVAANPEENWVIHFTNGTITGAKISHFRCVK
jgi:hypothetical protein